MFLALALLLLALFAVFSYLRPKLALVFLFSVLPIYLLRFELAGLPSTLLEGMILLLAAAVLLKLLLQKTLVSSIKDLVTQHKVLLVLLVLFLLSAGLAISYSVDFSRALGIYRAYFLEPALVLLVFFVVEAWKIRTKTLSLGPFCNKYHHFTCCDHSIFL